MQVGIYINAPAEQFLEWLESWTASASGITCTVCSHSIRLGHARRRVLLSRRLVVEIPARVPASGHDSEDAAYPISFQILPVGTGPGVEVIGSSDIQELTSYLVSFASAAIERWPKTAAHTWFGKPPGHPTCLCQFTIPAGAAILGRQLARFAAGFSSSEISSVSFLHQASVGQPDMRKNWMFRLSLRTDGPWQAIDHIALLCDIAQAAQTPPVTLTLWRHGFTYRQIEPFIDALISFCRSRWPDTQAPHQMQRNSAPNGARRYQNTVAADQPLTLADRPWELVANVAWDRLLVELWWKDHPSAIIAQHAGVTPKTVLNRLSQLRKIYGKNVIPTETQRRGRNREKSGYPG
jgi:hypothetical protein